MSGIVPSSWAPQKAAAPAQARVGACRAQGREQRGVVEHPAPARGEERLHHWRPRTVANEVALAGGAAGGSGERLVRRRRGCAPRWTASPVAMSGRSATRQAAPGTNISPNTAAPDPAAVARPLSTGAPPITAGTASNGSARAWRTQATTRRSSPRPPAAAGISARMSIAYCSAPRAATPPGTILPKAFEASCDVITGTPAMRPEREPLDRPHAAVAAQLQGSIARNQSGLRSSSRPQAPNTLSIAGATR